MLSTGVHGQHAISTGKVTVLREAPVYSPEQTIYKVPMVLGHVPNVTPILPTIKFYPRFAMKLRTRHPRASLYLHATPLFLPHSVHVAVSAPESDGRFPLDADPLGNLPHLGSHASTFPE